MKSLLFIYLFLSFINSPTLDEVRSSYKNAGKSKKNAIAFYEKAKTIKSKKATLIGYKAAGITLKAKYVKGVKNKKRLFKEGVAILEAQIKKYPKNKELRLIRLSIQENTPKLLKYKLNIFQDKEFLMKHIKFIKNTKKRNYFKSFVSQSKSFSKEEKSVISAL